MLILSLFSSARQAFQTRAALQAEILAPRHQLLLLQSSSRGHRLRLSRVDQFLWVWLAPFWSIGIGHRQARDCHRLASQGTLTVLEVEESPSGRPFVSLEVIDLIHRMSLANHGWGAPVGGLHHRYERRVA
jgi:hypothetical protein